MLFWGTEERLRTLMPAELSGHLGTGKQRKAVFEGPKEVFSPAQEGWEKQWAELLPGHAGVLCQG